MIQILRGMSDTLGVGFLIMQLIKLIGMLFALVGPLKFISSVFEGIFPHIASFFRVNFGLSINGMDVMAVAIAVSGSLIIWSCISRTERLKTGAFWRFLLVPYAIFIIGLAIIVQVSTPMVEMNSFKAACEKGQAEASFYGSSCEDMTHEIVFWDQIFGDAPIPETGEDGVIREGEFAGVSFMLALAYISIVLPLLALIAFFMKRLSINRLLRRVSIALGSAAGLALASLAYSIFMA